MKGKGTKFGKITKKKKKRTLSEDLRDLHFSGEMKSLPEHHS